jgi:hypothetical protein
MTKRDIANLLKDRFIRLGIPTIIYMFILHPILGLGILGYRIDTSDFVADGDGSILTSYIEYLTGFHFIGGSGPLWFTFALLIFSIIYATLRKYVVRKTLA